MDQPPRARRTLAALRSHLGLAAAPAAVAEDNRIARLRGQPLHMPAPPKIVAAMAAQLEEDGFLHLPGCLSPDETQRLRSRSEWLEKLCRSDTPPRTQPGNSWAAIGDDMHQVHEGDEGDDMHLVNAMHYHPDFLITIDKHPTLGVAEVALGPGTCLMG